MSTILEKIAAIEAEVSELSLRIVRFVLLIGFCISRP